MKSNPNHKLKRFDCAFQLESSEGYILEFESLVAAINVTCATEHIQHYVDQRYPNTKIAYLCFQDIPAGSPLGHVETPAEGIYLLTDIAKWRVDEMPGPISIEITTDICAPIETCFDLARDIGFHVRSLAHTNERAIAGRTDGLIELGETVTWQAKHLGLTRQMTVKITAMDRPNHFRDEQTDGPFKHFIHDHTFEEVGDDVTRMTDMIDFASPYGLIGRVVDRLYLTRYLHHLIAARGLAIKAEAENSQ